MIAQSYLGFDYINAVNNPWFFNIGVPLLIIAGFWLLNYLAGRLLTSSIARHIISTDASLNNKMIHSVIRPLRYLIFLSGIYTALIYLPLSSDIDLFVSKLYRSGLILMIAWGAGNIAGNESFLSSEFRDRLRLDKILVTFFLKVIKFVIWALAIVLIAHEWNYDVNGFIAGLGLGGLAFALAAKDALANIFGGIVIIMEKPFSIGDWVQTPDVDGTVEEISFRSTRFRTSAQALVTVPNSNLSNKPITNLSRMGKRLTKFTLCIDYAGPREKIENCLNEMRQYLKNNPVVHPQTVMVNLDSINANGLDILFYFYTNTTDWGEYQSVKEDINYHLMDILASSNIPLAAPGRIIYSEKMDEAKIVLNEIAR
jgi:Small-conductance mechanosensitive channel